MKDIVLSPEDEAKFQAWFEEQHKAGNIQPGDYNYYKKTANGYDYDFRVAFKQGLTPDPKTKHWGDAGKKPNHPTFSNESIYADANAPHWEGDNLVSPAPLKKPKPQYNE